MPTTVAAIILMKSAPFIFRAINTPLIIMAIIPRMDVGVKLPSPTIVAGFATIIPAFFKPIKAMNIPMPTEIA